LNRKNHLELIRRVSPQAASNMAVVCGMIAYDLIKKTAKKKKRKW
jgi:hypothetical protein